ncbi:MAG: hypothetical protein DMG60_10975 [Acidobacteria bacterium]|nr:MAG: hypothetical protein DMG60_10975 [Acidobacteriota bacterium]
MWCAYAQVTKRPREAQDSRSQCRKAWVEGSSDNGAPEARTSYILADCAALPALHLFSPSDQSSRLWVTRIPRFALAFVSFELVSTSRRIETA